LKQNFFNCAWYDLKDIGEMDVFHRAVAFILGKLLEDNHSLIAGPQAVFFPRAKERPDILVR
jgi:hypothetical protein